MPYVVTQSCCADASCVVACPVNCIHPAPGEPGFAEAEMLYVDANSCVDCGACATACPADAVVPHTALSEAQLPFLKLNADYYEVFPHAGRAPLAIVPPQRRLTRPGPFRVAVVGAGPAGLYTADELLKHPEVSVDVYDRLPTPYGLVRAGVAPDHQHTKQVDQLFRAIEQLPGFRYFLGVEVGRDLSLEELTAQYDGVVYAVGASSDRSLGIEGEELTGSVSATDVVGWYNGHPDKQDLDLGLDRLVSGRVVIVGNGNVALDVARILTADPAELERTDIAAVPWSILHRSRVREVVVLGRRGAAQAAFTVPELIGLAGLRGVNVTVTGLAPEEADAGAGAVAGDERSRLLAELAARPRRPGLPTIELRFLTSPTRIVGDEHGVTGVEVVTNRLEPDARGELRAVPTQERELLETGLVLRSVGYRGEPVADLPHDPATGVVPSDRGRVRPGVYVVGWAKRGPSGFIGTNKTCAQETVTRILDDLDAGATATPVGTPASIAEVVRGRCPDVVDVAGWQAIDAEERRRGAARGRARAKIVDVEEMVRVARQGARRPARRRYPSAKEWFEKRS
ncbi:FAD-dependent oxidoreductase [Nocardioides psychrotolerans]|uniref:FAD-dependent oxidoreductase n=1 Tax=Nocardioides psychrotolerans TaxID=1005945 RepID=UPI0031380554